MCAMGQISRKLGESDREDIFELYGPELARKVYVSLETELQRLRAESRARDAMRHSLNELERGISEDEIIDQAEIDVVRAMQGRTQVATEVAASSTRRLYRLALKIVRPFAFLPGRQPVDG